MSITFKLVGLAVVGFVVVISILTVIFGTLSWLVDRFGWKAWVVILLLISFMGYALYDNFGYMIEIVLTKIQ